MKIRHKQSFSQYWLIIFPLVLAIASNLHVSQFYASHDVPKWLVIDILLSLFIFTHARKISFSLSILNTSYIVMLYMMVASLLWVANVWSALEFIIRFIMFGLSLSLFIRVYSKAQRYHLLINTSLASSALFSLVYLAERLMDVPVSSGALTPIGFTNNAGHVFNIWIPVLAYVIVSGRYGVARVVTALFSLLVILYVLNIADIRATVIGLSIGSLFYLCLVSFSKHPDKIRRIKAVFFVSLVVMLVYYSGVDGIAKQYTERAYNSAASIEKTLQDPQGAYKARMNIINNSWMMLQSHPLGVGVNQFEYYHPFYGKPGTADASPYINENHILTTPHNFIVTIFTELGWVGGVAIILIYVCLFLVAVKNVMNDCYPWLIIPIVAFLLHSLLSQVFLSPLSYVFGLILFSTVISYRPSNQKIGFRVIPAVLKLALCIPALSMANTASDFYHYQGGYQRNVALLKKAVAINPGNDQAWFALSTVYFESFQDVHAASHYAEGFLALNPAHIYGRFYFGKLLMIEGSCIEAANNISQVLSYYPTYQDAQSAMKEAMECKGRQIMHAIQKSNI